MPLYTTTQQKAKISKTLFKYWAPEHFECCAYNVVKVFMVSCLDTLITGARRHPPTMKVVRNIVNEIFMICCDTFHYKHLIAQIFLDIVLNSYVWKLSNRSRKHLKINAELHRRHISLLNVKALSRNSTDTCWIG